MCGQRLKDEENCWQWPDITDGEVFRHDDLDWVRVLVLVAHVVVVANTHDHDQWLAEVRQAHVDLNLRFLWPDNLL